MKAAPLVRAVRAVLPPLVMACVVVVSVAAATVGMAVILAIYASPDLPAVFPGGR